MLRKIIYLFLLCLAVSVVALGAFYLSQQTKQPSTSINEEVYQEPATFELPTPPPIESEAEYETDLKQTAWIPDWAFNSGFTSLKANSQYFHSVSPVWYHLEADAKVKVNRVGYRELRDFTKQKGIKLIPSIASFSADDFNKILGDEAELTKHIEYIKAEINTYDYDGFDLDYESIYIDNQPGYLRLVRELYEHLDPQDKILSIAVRPNWSNRDISAGLRMTRAAQDWSELGMYVHELRIMTYELTGSRSTYPGPIGPLDWIEANLRYARTKLDMQKVVVGVHLYAYGGWSNNPVLLDNYLYSQSITSDGKVQASALTYSDIITRKSGSSEDKMDPSSMEKVMMYNLGGRKNIAFYLDAEAALYRLAQARRYNAAGVAYWRMGGEPPDIYKIIND